MISDGKEYGSKATYKDVLRYLQTNKIAVYGTAVGDSARWGEGYVSRLHLPFTMYDNRLAGYVLATGGVLDSEGSLNGIEKSYARIPRGAQPVHAGVLQPRAFDRRQIPQDRSARRSPRRRSDREKGLLPLRPGLPALIMTSSGAAAGLGLLSAATWGGSDFAGGWGARRARRF